MNVERFETLCKFLDKVPDELFDFEFITDGIANAAEHEAIYTQMKEAYEHNACGTTGCALGWCPIIWPGEWQYIRGGSVKLKGSHHNFVRSAAEWFDISYDDAHCLFIPWTGNQNTIPVNRLGVKALATDVSARIRRYIARRMTGAALP